MSWTVKLKKLVLSAAGMTAAAPLRSCRLAEGRASALEQKRADKQPVGRELEVLRMMHERSRLIRDLEAGNNNERGR